MPAAGEPPPLFALVDLDADGSVEASELEAALLAIGGLVYDEVSEAVASLGSRRLSEEAFEKMTERYPVATARAEAVARATAVATSLPMLTFEGGALGDDDGHLRNDDGVIARRQPEPQDPSKAQGGAANGDASSASEEEGEEEPDLLRDDECDDRIIYARVMDVRSGERIEVRVGRVQLLRHSNGMVVRRKSDGKASFIVDGRSTKLYRPYGGGRWDVGYIKAPCPMYGPDEFVVLDGRRM